MNTPDENHPKKHFFKIPTNYFELSEEERQAFCLEIATILDADDEDEVQKPGDKEAADSLESEVVFIWGLPQADSHELTEVLYVGASRAISDLTFVGDKEELAVLTT